MRAKIGLSSPVTTNPAMQAPPELVKGGLVRRALALFVDLIVVEMLIQMVAVIAFPLSGGLLVDTNSVYTSCVDTAQRPTGVEIPPELHDAKTQDCTKSFLGWPTARLLTLVRHDTAHAAVSVSYEVDKAGRTTPVFDLGQLQLLVVALMRWALERRGWPSLGRKWLSLRVVARGDNSTEALNRRYRLFALPLMAALVIEVAAFALQLAGQPIPAELLVVLTFLGNLPSTVAVVAVAAAIWRRRDPFYDARAGTTTARLVGGEVEVASDHVVPFGHYWSGGAVSAGRHVSARQAPPWVGLALVILLAAIYGAELIFASRIKPGPTFNTTLVVFGGMSHELVIQVGQWYRLVTSIFLHASFAHLLANSAVLLAAAWFLEGVLGRGWLLATFLLGGLGGSVASVSLNEPSAVSVGASGAVTAVVAAGLVVSAGLADDERRLWLRAFCLSCLLAALQASGQFAWITVDRADHFGGAAAGAILGGVILASWRRDAIQPSRQGLALGAALAVALALFVSVPRAGFGDPPLTALLVPEDQLPKTDAEWEARSADIVRRYPADWRGYLGRAMAAGDDRQEREVEMNRAITAALRFENDRAKVDQSVFMTLGASREAARDWPAAQELYGRAIAAMPNDPNALGKRAYTELNQDLIDDALRDLNADVRLRPNDAEPEIRLSDTLMDNGQLDDAVTALDRALALAPDSQIAFRSRGWIGFLAGRGESSLADLERAANLDPKDPYAALWLDIAAVRSGGPDRFERLARSLDLATWPGPVLKFFLGQSDVDGLMGEAEGNADPIKRSEQHCEAEFYYAEWQIMHGGWSRAHAHLEDAVASCPKSFYEFYSAKAELAKEAGNRQDASVH